MKEYKEYIHENKYRDETIEDGWRKQWVKGKQYQFNNENEIVEWIKNENIQDKQISLIHRNDDGTNKVIWEVYCDEVKTCQP